MKSIIKNLLIKYSSCENMFKHFHHCSLWTLSSSREEILKITKILSSRNKVKNDGWRERRAFWEVLLWTFSFPNRGRIFLHEQLVSREDFWFQDQEQQPADNEKIPVQKIRILNLNLNTIIIRLYTPIWCRYDF